MIPYYKEDDRGREEGYDDLGLEGGPEKGEGEDEGWERGFMM
jgi:hypothetical protein